MAMFADRNSPMVVQATMKADAERKAVEFLRGSGGQPWDDTAGESVLEQLYVAESGGVGGYAKWRAAFVDATERLAADHVAAEQRGAVARRNMTYAELLGAITEDGRNGRRVAVALDGFARPKGIDTICIGSLTSEKTNEGRLRAAHAAADALIKHGGYDVVYTSFWPNIDLISNGQTKVVWINLTL